ncbi:UPF0548 protein At2g17695 isoform X2 [Magnolia sinica]|uniref:UPF0548 protein At2g17695 isoform X2 n=1 Tax=Magnolia sinica TaxID=86752 RepID=UPI002658FF1E|nr:UPF0548 protein At2g17695 isoform X2 [Magnolia sinica]
MLFLSWKRPSPQQQKICIDKSGGFNYDIKYEGASSKTLTSSQKQELSKDGFFVNEARILLGSGLSTYNHAKTALLTWSLKWAFVDPKTSLQTGTKFCVCVKEFLPWIMMPLQVAYVFDESSSNSSAADRKLTKASFGFGSGTLHGHLLAGEERFSVELDEKNQVWYEILSFSKPAHLLSFIGYPYVQLRQKYFTQQSMQSVVKHVNAQQCAM